jgi:DNA-binding transcriptional ArsR family regulator
MPRATTTSDVFNAIAEPRRRQILGVLAGVPRPVGALVAELRLPQPAVSKHLRVLRQVGLVRVRKQGQHRLYELNAEELKPVRDWIARFERHWEQQLDRIQARAERKARARAETPPAPHQEQQP